MRPSMERDRGSAEDVVEWSLLRRIQSPCEKRRDRRPDRLCIRHAGVYPGKWGGIARRASPQLPGEISSLFRGTLEACSLVAEIVRVVREPLPNIRAAARPRR